MSDKLHSGIFRMLPAGNEYPFLRSFLHMIKFENGRLLSKLSNIYGMGLGIIADYLIYPAGPVGSAPVQMTGPGTFS